MKYVLLKHPATGETELRCGFGFDCSHKEIAAAAVKQGYRPVGAGHFRWDEFGRVETYGRSAGLGIGPLAEDAGEIEMRNRLAGAALRAERLADRALKPDVKDAGDMGDAKDVEHTGLSGSDQLPIPNYQLLAVARSNET